MIIVTVSAANKCAYCVDHHVSRLASQGLSGESIERILEIDVPGFDPVDQLVGDFALQITPEPYRISISPLPSCAPFQWRAVSKCTSGLLYRIFQPVQ